jgi:hypothetical protein
MLIVMPANLDANPSSRKAEDISTCASSGSHFLKSSDGPFTLMLTCEDALGRYLGVLYTGQMIAPSVKAWKIDYRYWVAEEWKGSPTSFVWLDANRIAVATDEVASDPAVYVVDLLDKKTKKVASHSLKKPFTKSFKIISYDPSNRTLEFDEERDTTKTKKHILKIE